MRHLLPVLVLTLGGCSTQTVALNERWRPLVEVVERPDLLISAGVATTLGTRLYVADLRAFEASFPAGSVEREALLLHEQVHAQRQLGEGLGPWLARYLNDADFMWREEQEGWFLQLRHLQANGRPLAPVVIAELLAGYRNLTGPMVSAQEALTWVQDVLAGRWSPSSVPASVPPAPEEGL